MYDAEQTIIDFICERGPHDPPTFHEIADIVPTEVRLLATLRHMIETGAIETMQDEERGTVYVRDC